MSLVMRSMSHLGASAERIFVDQTDVAKFAKTKGLRNLHVAPKGALRSRPCLQALEDFWKPIRHSVPA